MASLAELFVRVRGDTSDVTTKLKGVEGSMLSMGRAAEAGHLPINKMTRAFETLIVQTLGVNREVAVLGTVLGDFAVGGAVVAGVVGGLALIGAAYAKLTEDTREARKEQDKLIKSLQDAIHLKGLGPGGETVEQVDAAKARSDALKAQIATLEGMVVKDAQDADVLASNAIIQDKINKLYIERQNILNTIAGGQSIINEKTAAALVPVRAHTKELKDQNALLVQYNELMARTYGTWGMSSNFTANPVPFAGNIFQGPALGGPVDVSDAVRIAGQQAKQINDAAKKHSDDIREAIWGSAAALANSVVSALNLGGGGRGSSLGGALGGTAGFAAGFVFGGPIGGAIGSTLGNIAGSLLGGLFDHKKAIETNTAAVRQNTAALLLNSPSGYKVASGQFDATVIKDLRNAAQRYATRGGAPAFVTP